MKKPVFVVLAICALCCEERQSPRVALSDTVAAPRGVEQPSRPLSPINPNEESPQGTVSDEMPDDGSQGNEIAEVLAKRVAIRFAKTPLREALQFLETLTEIRFVLCADVRSFAGATVNLERDKILISEALEQILRPFGLGYRIDNGRVNIESVRTTDDQTKTSRENGKQDSHEHQELQDTHADKGVMPAVSTTGKGLSAAIEWDKRQFSRSEPIEFSVTFKNVSDSPFLLFDVDFYRWWRFTFAEKSLGGKTWRAMSYVKYLRESLDPICLLPGEEHRVGVCLDEDFEYYLLPPLLGKPYLAPCEYTLRVEVTLREYIDWTKLAAARKTGIPLPRRKWPHPFWTGTINAESTLRIVR